jgi:uncharacterized membrane protein YhhN
MNKALTDTSENWLSILTVITNLVLAVASQSKWTAVFAAFCVAVVGGVYAYFRTDLPSSKPGWKTKLFWTSIIVIVGSAALNLGQATIPGLSGTVTKYASMVAAVIAAAGYTLLRVEIKKTEMLFAKKQTAQETK